MAGRPTKKTDGRVAILIQALEECTPLEIALDYAQIDRSTLWRWCQNDPDFALRINYAKAKAIRSILPRAIEKDPMRILESLNRKIYGKYVVMNTPEGMIKELHEADGKEPKLLEAIAVSDGD